MTSGPAPQFDLPGLAGDRTSLPDLLVSGPVLLAFFKVTCPTCQLTFPFLERLHRGRSLLMDKLREFRKPGAGSTWDPPCKSEESVPAVGKTKLAGNR